MAAAAPLRKISATVAPLRQDVVDGTVAVQPGMPAKQALAASAAVYPPGTCPPVYGTMQQCAVKFSDGMLLTSAPLQPYKDVDGNVAHHGAPRYDEAGFDPANHELLMKANSYVNSRAGHGQYGPVHTQPGVCCIYGHRSNKNDPFTMFNAIVVPGSVQPAVDGDGRPTIEFRIRLVNADDTYATTYPALYPNQPPPPGPNAA